MRKALLSLCLLALCLPAIAKGAFEQNSSDQMKDFTRVLSGDGVKLSLMHLNETTLPLMFQPPTLYSLRARSKESTLLYVQGTADKAVKLDTTTFTIEQGGEVLTSSPVNINHFEKGTASLAKGDQVNGVLVFSKIVDVTQPFTVKHGKDSVKIEFTKNQIRDMTPAPAK